MGLDMEGFSRRAALAARPTRSLACWLTAAAVLALTGAAAAGTAPPGAAGEPYAASRSYLRTHAGARQVWFICAPLDGFDQTVVGLPTAGQKLQVVQPLSNEPPEAYKLGAADPGAGQVYWPLSDLAGKEVGALHAFNPGALGDPKAAATPTFTSIRINMAQWYCRWLEHTRLLGFSSKRVIEITAGPGGLEYQSFDYRDAAKSKKVETGGAQQSTTPSLDLKGGRLIGGRMRFNSDGYSFLVSASAADARIVVTHAGRTILDEPLVAWTLGAP